MSMFFTKRSRSDASSTSASSKRQRTEETQSSNPVSPNPKRIVCWNCNGLSVRLRNEGEIDCLKSFLRTYNPDVFFLSEVRLPAAHNAGPRKPTAATTFYRNRLRDTDPSYLDVNGFLHSPECEHYKVYFSLADTKYSGTAMFVNTQTTALPTSVRFNLKTLDVKRTVHDSDGRVIFAKFPSFSILHTYVPNNGWASDHFNRRKAWDDAMKAFMQRKKDSGVNVMWLGDLNTAPTDEDLSDAKYFRRQVAKPGNNRRGGSKADSAVSDENVGQPGCTDGERNRFFDILKTGDLVDAFREKNPHAGAGPDVFTWRGLLGGMMMGKGMRIDHCIASNSLMPNIEKVEVLAGASPNFPGFMGSDHCPVLVEYAECNTKAHASLNSIQDKLDLDSKSLNQDNQEGENNVSGHDGKGSNEIRTQKPLGDACDASPNGEELIKGEKSSADSEALTSEVKEKETS